MATGRPFFPGSTVEDQLHLIFKVSIYVDGRFSFFPTQTLFMFLVVRPHDRSVDRSCSVSRLAVRSAGRSFVRLVSRSVGRPFVVCSFHLSALWSACFASSNALFAVCFSTAAF